MKKSWISFALVFGSFSLLFCLSMIMHRLIVRGPCERSAMPYASKLIDGECYRATSSGGWEPVEENTP